MPGTQSFFNIEALILYNFSGQHTVRAKRDQVPPLVAFVLRQKQKPRAFPLIQDKSEML